MFVENADPATLRQGDILGNVPFPLPPTKSEELIYLGTPKEVGREGIKLEPLVREIGRKRAHWLTAHVPVAISFCAVLSQCCELDPKQVSPPPSFALCRLVPVPDSIRNRRDLYEVLRQNVDPYGDVRPFFLLFYVGSHPRLAGEYVADYGQTMTVRWGDYQVALRKKVLEMDDISRAKFRVKAGACFGRPTQEEVDAGIADPWRVDRPAARPREPLRERLVRASRVLLGKE